MPYLDIPANCTAIKAAELTLPKASNFYKAVLASGNETFIAAHQGVDGDEVIIYETEPTVSQSPKHDIRYVERLYVRFDSEDRYMPEVFSLRPDFPEVPHLMLSQNEYPRQFCIYEIPYSELKLNWRAKVFLEDIRNWLTLTAKDELHQFDQPLEPFMLGYGTRIILPAKYHSSRELYFYLANKNAGRLTYLSTHTKISRRGERQMGFITIQFTLPPQVQTMVRFSPTNLLALDQLLKKAGVNFIDDYLNPYLKKASQNQEFASKDDGLILLITVPKLRHKDDTSPLVEIVCFAINNDTIERICLKTGVLIRGGGKIGLALDSTWSEDDVKSIQIEQLVVHSGFRPEMARVYNGMHIENQIGKIGLIGCGSLGSHVFNNLLRMGSEQWALIDDDVLLPHNSARHISHGAHIGNAKVESLKNLALSLYESAQVDILQANYLSAKDEQEIAESLNDVDLVLDISASLPVARKLSKQTNINARKVSVFLNPKGTDLVILAEPENKELSLIELEVLYYRFLCQTPALHQHFEVDDQPIRYSRSCRDISAVMEQDSIAILAGIAAKQVNQLSSNLSGMINIWNIRGNCQVVAFDAPLDKFRSIKKAGWTYKIAESLFTSIDRVREDKLPNETGGILIGMIDLENQTTYVVDTILSPVDSQEYPTAYYRGIAGVQGKLEDISHSSSDHLMYLGEWHSHPRGAGVNMSQADEILFSWIKDHLSSHGYPALMMIFGDRGEVGVCGGV